MPKHVGGGFVAALIGVSLLLLTGCSGFVDSDQTGVAPDASVLLEPGHPVGQTFVARHGGLSGVEVWLSPEPGARGELRLHLRTDPEAGEDLAVGTLPPDRVTEAGFYRFPFPPLPDAHGRYYYAFLELEGEGTVAVGEGPGDAYLDGALYRDHRPLDAQMAFRLVYDLRWMLLDLAWAAVQGLGLLAVAGLLYIVPGWALLAWLRPGAQLSWAERLGLAAGIGPALYPLLLLWTDLVGLHLGPLYAWLPVLLGLGGLAWHHRRWRPRAGWEELRRWACSDALWPDLTLLILLTLVFGIRLLVVRTLDAPMWGDSVQHTVIAQLLVDNNGLFDSWEPYAPYRSLTVHYGFHTSAALLSWVTGIEVTKATLLTGQLLNGLAILTLYPLAARLANGSRWAGVGAVLTAGLLSPMPAFYVNWGRYAQLAGQVVLPVALWLLWEAVEGRKRALSAGLLAGAVLAGMALSYYRMPLFYAPFVLAWLAVWGPSRWGREARLWLVGLARMALVAVVAGVLFLPWGVRLIGGHLAAALTAGISNSSPTQRVLADYQVWREVPHYLPLPLLVAALLGLGWALVRRRWVVASVGLWVGMLALWVAGRLVGFPAANMMQNFAVVIGLYIPASLLIGWLVGAAMEWAAQRRRTVCRWGWGVLLLALSLVGTTRQAKIVHPQFVMVTRPDTQAMAWVRENTPQDALFLVEGFRIYGGRSAVGADAGWWVPLLAGRRNTMPPQYALLNEVPAEPGYSQRVVELVAGLETTSPASSEGLHLLCEWGITHAYVGQGQGRVGLGATQLFSPQELSTSPFFDTLYHRDRVYIFALTPQACSGGMP